LLDLRVVLLRVRDDEFGCGGDKRIVRGVSLALCCAFGWLDIISVESAA
jgi:hypothetical protein